MRRLLAGLTAVALLGLVGACSGGGGSSDVTGAADVAADVPGGDSLPEAGDVPSVDVPADVPAVDQGPDQEPPAQACSPECAYSEGPYCDRVEVKCKPIACTPCLQSIDCGQGGMCLDYKFVGGAMQSVCSNACQEDADCAAGFTCGLEMECEPSALCPTPGCDGTGKLGDPCETKGLHVGCPACQAGLYCAGQMADTTCELATECVAAGVSALYNPECTTEGACGFSVCIGKCDEKGECPDGFVPGKTSSSCYCYPVGTAKPGDPCPLGDIHADKDYCAPGAVCFGFGGTQEADDCKTDADCAVSLWLGNPICLSGKCATSFCSPCCDDKGDCPLGFAASESADGKVCQCMVKLVGSGVAGDPCPIGKINADAPGCVAELQCVGSFSDPDNPDKCETAADCPPEYKGTVVCLDGECASTFCAAECDEEGTCPVGFETFGEDPCWCAPVPPSPTCAETCQGCCSGEECLPGDIELACGKDGQACAPCGDGQTCVAGVCACTPKDHKDCANQSVYWFDSCGVQGELVAECTAGKVCIGATCVCVAEDHKKCVDDEVYWFDSCDVQGELVDTCVGGTVCKEGACVCVALDHKACDAEKVYWYDSCDLKGTLVEECVGGTVCQEGACVCVAQDHKACDAEKVYWYDSCDVKGALVEECTGGKKCKEGSCVCVAGDHLACDGDKLFWYDSCNVKGVQQMDCAPNGQICQNGICVTP